MSWTAAFTPSGGSSTPLDGVTSVKVGNDGAVEKFKGDFAVFYTALAVPTRERTVDVDLASVYVLTGIAQGTIGTLVLTLADHKNGTTTGGGAITLTYTNCVLVKSPLGGEHAKFASGTASFEAISSDGTTDPLTVAAL